MAPYVGIRSRWRKKFNKKKWPLYELDLKPHLVLRKQTLWLGNVFKCKLKPELMPGCKSL